MATAAARFVEAGKEGVLPLPALHLGDIARFFLF
jgi:hypothetical protein